MAITEARALKGVHAKAMGVGMVVTTTRLRLPSLHCGHVIPRGKVLPSSIRAHVG